VKEIEFRSSLLPDGGITLTLEDVTEVRRTEENSRHGKLKFRALFSHSETGTVLVDRTGRIIDANPAFVSLSGISLKDLRLSSLSELLHPEEAANLAGLVDTVATTVADRGGDRSANLDVWLRTSEKEKRTRVTYCPIGESDGLPSMGIYLFTPVESASANEKLAARLRKVSIKAQSLLQAVPDLVLLVDHDGTIADFAPPSTPWKELKPDDSWCRQSAETVWPVFGNLFKQCRRQVCEEGRTIHADIRGPEKDSFEFSVSLSPCGDDQVLAVIRNQTETRALRERDFWQQAAFENSPQPVLLLNPRGVITKANPAANQLLSGSNEPLTGSEFCQFFAAGESALEEALHCAGSGIGNWTSHSPMISGDGTELGTTAEFLALEDGGKPRGSLVFVGERKAPAPLPAVPASDHTISRNEKRAHGFRNQLQLITSLFSLEPQGNAARDAFIRWQIRLRSMAQACPYDQSEDVWVFPLLRNLADDVCSLIGRGPGRKEVIITGNEEITLDLQTAAPFSLLIGELMRLVLATRQPGPGPELYVNLRPHAGGGFQITVRPGTNRKFIFTDRDSEVEILELLTEQIQGRLEATDQQNPANEWVLILPPVPR
jgi:PAS domain-containing protein